MKKTKSRIVSIMAIIGTICTLVVLCMLFKDRIKECSLFQKLFGGDEDLDFDLDLEDDFSEEEAVIEDEPVIEEESVVVPKARRGYIPLKFQTGETA